ncbi:hypothetical protein EV127DRAFT_512740 [Xylaria flabelliformis]|nr:hypothetical protein EV127DRAFT_512740 [Xylaria flabelliformis]
MSKFESYRESDTESNQSLLRPNSLDDPGDVDRLIPKRQQRFQPRWVFFGVLQLLFFSIYTAAVFYLRPAPRNSLVYSPAIPAIEYEAVRFNATLIIDSPWNGPPSDAVDQAWSDLLHNMNVAVHKSDLARIDTHSIPIPGMKDMYFAGLSVFHELHCIKRLRQYTWLDHYFPDLNEEEKHLNRLHTDHCLEILRQAAMCRSDTALFTIRWKEATRQPIADFSQKHECASFDKINKWAAEHRVDPSEPGLLVHPLYGPAYREGEYSRIGASLDKSKILEEEG